MQYLDDEPLGERIDRPRSHTWPLLPPPEIVDRTRGGKSDTPDPEPQQSISSEISEGRKSDGTSPRKNSRKNAWGNLSYADLITQAIDSSPEKRLTLAQVYEWMVKNVHYFKDKGDSTSSAGWKNSIRHNLSLHSRFMRIQNDQNGKSSYWVINPDAKPGKASRRRSGSIEGAPKQERKRGHKKKNSEDGCNLSPTSGGPIRNGSKQNHSVESPGAVITMSPCSSTDSLSGLPDLEENGNFVFSSDSFTRPRSTSNVSTQSSVGGRLTPIPGDETEDDLVTSPYSNHYDGNQGEPLEIPVSRPRGSSGADETAHLLESVNIRAHDTINLDDSLKYVETTVGGGGGGGYTVTETGLHSDSFSSVQSVDSGYDSSPVSTYYTSNMSPQQPPRLNSVHNMMPLPAKPPPPPYNSQQGVQFTPIRQPQAQPHIIQRQIQQLPIRTPAEMHVHQNYYSGVPSHMVNQRGYVSTQQAPRLQHLPSQTTTNNVGYRKATTLSSFRRSAMNTMSDPYLPSVTSANIKDTRNMSGMSRNSYIPSLSALPMEQDLGTTCNDIFPSDLSHVPLHDFNDQFQLARDLETIIRNEMEGNMQMDFLDQQAPNSYVPSSSTVNVAGQSWVH